MPVPPLPSLSAPLPTGRWVWDEAEFENLQLKFEGCPPAGGNRRRLLVLRGRDSAAPGHVGSGSRDCGEPGGAPLGDSPQPWLTARGEEAG